MSRPRLATMVLGGCTGCHLSLLDAHEELLELLGKVELVHSPFSGNGRMPAADLVLVEGAVATDRDEIAAREARAAAGCLVAMGSCATLGGIGGLRNLYDSEDVLSGVYGQQDVPSEGVPALQRRVRALGDVVPVDVAIPGCSPDTETLVTAVKAILSGEGWEPPRRNLCRECGRKHETMLVPSAEFVSDAVRSIMELDSIDPERCFVEQGVVCMGPMTRSGCGARCTQANVPCRGCVGPSRPGFEQGAKTIDALAAVLPAGAIMFMDDLVGTGYRYTLPTSIIPGLVGGGDDE